MKRIYHHYESWECFKNGMYNLDKKENELDLIEKSSELLKNENEFLKVSLTVLDKWIISSDVNLSNTSQNRQAWIGQSACNYQFGISEVLTRIAWSKLTENEMYKANLIADKIIKIYEAKNKQLHQRMGGQMLFEWNT